MIKFSSYHRSSSSNQPVRRRSESHGTEATKLSSTPRYFKKGHTIVQKALDISDRSSLRDLTFHRQFLIKAIIILVLVISLTAIIIWQTIYQVSPQVIGFEQLPATIISDYSQTIDQYFNQHPLERFSLALDVDNLNLFLNQKRPEIAKVSDIELRFLRPTLIKLNPRLPLAMWIINGIKYYVDNQGQAFTHNFFDDPSLEVIDQSGLDPGQVPKVASANFLGFVGQTIALSADKGLIVQKIVIPPMTTRQIEVYFDGYLFPVKFMTSNSVPRQVEDAYRSLKFLKDRNIVPVYLDVRVSQKAYYK